MRAEKKYLIAEVETHLKKSDYVILANFTGVTVADVADLRAQARRREGRVPRRQEQLAARRREGPRPARHRGRPHRPDGDRRRRQEFAGVAKVLKQFFKDKQKVSVKAGVLSKKLITAKEVEQLADMPSLEALRAQLLGLLNQPAGAFVRVINAVPQGLVNVLQAKVRAAGRANPNR